MVPLLEAMARKLRGGRPLTRDERLLPWLALVAYLAAGCLGGWSLHQEAATCRRLARTEVVHRIRELDWQTSITPKPERRCIP